MTPDPLPKVPLKSLKLGSQALLESRAAKRLCLHQTPLALEEKCHVVEATQSVRVVFAQFGFAWARQYGRMAQIACPHKGHVAGNQQLPFRELKRIHE